MISLEIVVTLVATLTTLMLTIFIIERNALRRIRLKNSLEALDLAKKLNCDQACFNDLVKSDFEPFTVEKKRPYPLSFRFLGQTIFGIAVFIGFAGWTYYLLNQEYIWWAAASAVFALIGMVMPFIIWRGFKQRAEDIDRLLRGMKHYEKILAERESQRPTIEEPSIAVTVAEAPTIVAKTAETTEEKEAIPEDSVLRRHYLTQRQAEQEALTNPYPTDSVLKRHYDTMVRSLLAIERPDDIKQPAMAMPAEKEAIPEDSVLRRHYLTQRQAEQEALTNPYPTDSVLRRHYDTMVKSLLTIERPDDIRQPAVAMDVNPVSQTKSKALQDYKFKRRYTNRLRAEIEAGLFPRPTDSVLRRHYDTLIENEMENAIPEWMLEKNSSSVPKNLNN